MGSWCPFRNGARWLGVTGRQPRAPGLVQSGVGELWAADRKAGSASLGAPRRARHCGLRSAPGRGRNGCRPPIGSGSTPVCPGRGPEGVRAAGTAALSFQAWKRPGDRGRRTGRRRLGPNDHSARNDQPTEGKTPLQRARKEGGSPAGAPPCFLRKDSTGRGARESPPAHAAHRGEGCPTPAKPRRPYLPALKMSARKSFIASQERFAACSW